MDDIRREIASLRSRLRLQMFVSLGVVTIITFAMGGADVVARGLVESDAWKVRTRKADLSVVERLVVSTDVDQATVKVSKANLVMDSTAGSQANIKLAEQTVTPSNPAPGMLWYDSNSGVNKFKYYNGTTWTAGSPPGMILVSSQTFTSNQQVITFSGLNGDQDRVYEIFLSSLIGVGGIPRVTFNGNVNLIILKSGVQCSGTTLSGLNTAGSHLQNISATAGQTFTGHIKIEAVRTAWRRFIKIESIDGNVNTSTQMVGELDPTTNITSIELRFTDAGRFGNPTHARLYKYESP